MVATIFSSLAFLSSSFSMASLNHLVASILSSLAFLSSSISMAKLSRLVAQSFSCLALLSYSVSTANLRCLLATTFSSLSYLPTHFHHLASSFTLLFLLHPDLLSFIVTMYWSEFLCVIIGCHKYSYFVILNSFLYLLNSTL